MKKILAFILVALMVLPFGVMASAAAPEEPVLTSNNLITVAAAKTNANYNYPDLAPDKVVGKANTWEQLFTGSLKSGGTMVFIGKGFASEGATLEATSSPVVFTAVKDGVSYISLNEDGTYNHVDGKAAGAGQYGCLMLTGEKTMTFKGDVIFDDVAIFNRSNKPGTLRAEGKLVVKNNVIIATKVAGASHILEVAEGGVAFLHQIGFSKYTGKGTIVIGDEIKDKITADVFADFGGELIYADGSKVDGFAPNPNTPADTTANTSADSTATTNAPASTTAPADGEVTKKTPVTIRKPKTEAPETETAPETTPATTDNGNGGMLMGIIIGVAAAAIVGIVVIIVTKKKPEKKD